MNFSDAHNLDFLDLIRKKSADLLNVKRENYGRKKVLRLLMSSLRLGLTQNWTSGGFWHIPLVEEFIKKS